MKWCINIFTHKPHRIPKGVRFCPYCGWRQVPLWRLILVAALVFGVITLIIRANGGGQAQQIHNATATAVKYLGATRIAEFDGTATAGARQAATGREGVIFGPRSGGFALEDGIGIELAGVEVRDFVVEARFYNPYALSRGSWTIGFIFRSDVPRVLNFYSLTLFSEGRSGSSSWVLNYYTGPGEIEVIRRDDFSDFDTTGNGSNLLRLTVDGEEGSFSLNGEYVADLDLSRSAPAGDISIVMGFEEDFEISEKGTQYEDFTIWALP